MTVLYALLAAMAFGDAYANLTYAEGGSFRIVRSGKTSVWDASSQDVFGMEIMIGDLISTGPGTVLELSVHPVSASVQIAENTSYSCTADESGKESKGELFYGRVHAKVAKLSGGSSFRISSPSLVAGVRGTDFGCDVIAVKPSAEPASPGSGTAAPASPVLSRVFVFEGTVAVAPARQTVLETVLVDSGKMVELLSTGAASGESALEVTPLSEEIRSYWQEIPAVGYIAEGESAPAAAESPKGPEWRSEGGYLVLDRSWPRSGESPVEFRTARLPNWAATALMIAGSAACNATSIYATQTGSAAWFVESGYSAGIVMTGTGAMLAILAALFD